MARVILVTGGNRGIGLEICRQLAKLGHNVIMATRNLKKGKEASAEINSIVDVQVLDVTNTEQIEKLDQYINDTYGRLDVIINNAGIGIGNKGALEADMEEVKQIMATNFHGPWQVTQKLMPLLRKSEAGRVINMSSGMGSLDELTGDYAGYRLSKSALNALTILTANELADSSIKVNAMCPGWVKTDMGGDGASRSVAQGADTAVWLALEENIANGKFFRDREVIPW